MHLTFILFLTEDESFMFDVFRFDFEHYARFMSIYVGIWDAFVGSLKNDAKEKKTSFLNAPV